MSMVAYPPQLRETSRLRINLATMQEAVARLGEAASMRQGFTLFTLNLDHLVKLRTDAAFRAAYAAATYVTADGWPVVFMARLKGAKLERTTGADMIVPLCAEAEKRKLRVYFFGSSDSSLQLAAARLKRRFPRLEVVGMEAPAYGFDPLSPAALEAGARIGASAADLCFLALGAPKQELLAARLHALHPGIGFLCIGAALDFIAGHQERAPRLMQKTGTEWLYRLASNPRRLAGRYARSLLLFAELLLKRLVGRPDDLLDFSVRDLPR